MAFHLQENIDCLHTYCSTLCFFNLPCFCAKLHNESNSDLYLIPYNSVSSSSIFYSALVKQGPKRSTSGKFRNCWNRIFGRLLPFPSCSCVSFHMIDQNVNITLLYKRCSVCDNTIMAKQQCVIISGTLFQMIKVHGVYQ